MTPLQSLSSQQCPCAMIRERVGVYKMTPSSHSKSFRDSNEKVSMSLGHIFVNYPNHFLPDHVHGTIDAFPLLIQQCHLPLTRPIGRCRQKRGEQSNICLQATERGQSQ